MHYYNENDPKAAAWLKELMAAGIIPEGHIDERSILEVRASDLAGFVSCHFFAGIGGWPYALRLAGWPDDRRVWTGSCPCQPFSVAGKGLGEKDERHLWPTFRQLIAEYREQFGDIPDIFGEQVASADGRNWLAGVRADLEALGFVFGSADLCAASTGEDGEGWIVLRDQASWQPIILSAPNIRQRLFWMAYPASLPGSKLRGEPGEGLRRVEATENAAERTGACGLAEPECNAGEQGRPSDESRKGVGASQAGSSDESGRCRLPSGMEYSEQSRLEGHSGNGNDRNKSRWIGEEESRPTAAPGSIGNSGMADGNGGKSWNGRIQSGREYGQQQKNSGLGFWSESDFLPCLDGKARRVEPGSFPLAHGIPGRVGLLRGYGNAINPVLAAEFIQACLEARQEMPGYSRALSSPNKVIGPIS